MRIVGASTWLDAGRPVTASSTLSTRALRGVVEYVPGDLVITVRAGTSLAELAEITAEYGQWLALDPHVSAQGLSGATIGATIATSSSGPLALGFGRARDLVLGMSLLTGDGTALRVGGRVVKNVAGFDLVRLNTGAWGTLGVITEVSLRLHARPAVDESIAISVDVPTHARDYETRLATLVSQCNSAPLLATTNGLGAFVLLLGDAATAVASAHGLPASSALFVARATGNATRVGAIRAALSVLGSTAIVDTSVWNTIRSLDHGDTTLRISDAPSRLSAQIGKLNRWIDAAGATRSRIIVEPLRGAVRVSMHSNSTQLLSDTLPNRAIAERLPAHAWRSQPSLVAERISSRLLETFDRAGILNPGILGDAHAMIAT